MESGMIVIASAGKEKGERLVVVRCDEKFVYLADGKRLKAQKPKKKSLKHVKACGKERLILDAEELRQERVNAKLREFLKRSKHV